MIIFTEKRSGIQLCYPFEERRLLNPKFGWKWPVICQPKLDGDRIRVLANGKYNPVILLSSTQHIITSLPHINKAFQEQNLYGEFDGEGYRHGWNFGQINGVISRTVNLHPNHKKIAFYCFDLINNHPQINRISTLTDLKFDYPIVKVPFNIAYNMIELMNFYNKYLDNEYEGIIIRHLLANYIRKRSRFVMKFKPKKKDMYNVIDIIEGNGEHHGMVGTFICSRDEEKSFSVGAGEIKHDKRKAIWNNRRDYIGAIIQVNYQSITKNGIPRFGLAKEIVTMPDSSMIEKETYKSYL